MIPTLLQIIVSVFVLFALSRVFLRVRKHELDVREALFWSVIWAGFAVVVWAPITVTILAHTLGLSGKEPIDTLVYLAIVALFYLVYRIHAKQEKLNHELTRLVRAVSLGKQK
jgi:hypothetical protein